MSTTYYVISWTDQNASNRGRQGATREYGTTRSKQAAIRLAEQVLPPDADYLITTLYRTVHHGRTPTARCRAR